MPDGAFFEFSRSQLGQEVNKIVPPPINWPTHRARYIQARISLVTQPLFRIRVALVY